MDRTTTYGHSGGSGVRPFEGLADAVRELLADAEPADPVGPTLPVDLGTTPPVRFADPLDRSVRVVMERAEAADDAISELHSVVESLRASNERAERSIAELRSMNEELRASNAQAERSIAELRSVNDRLEVSNAQASADAEEARRESDRAFVVSVVSLLVSVASLLASVFL
ncbi:hypothetical protein AAK967_02390 [Atopobiaceae bacterium 24-176]